MSRPLRIGYMVPQFPGQTHIYFWREIQALEALGHDVHLLSTRAPAPGLIAHRWSQEAIARTRYLGHIAPARAVLGLARLLPQGLPPWALREGPRFVRDLALTLSAAEGLRRYARRHRLDHVHSHSCGRSAMAVAVAHRIGGPPYSLTLHGPLADYGPGQRFKWHDAAFARVITRRLEMQVMQELSHALPPRLRVQPMGVDTQVWTRDTPYTPPEAGRPIRLFCCARLNMYKGHQDLLTAMRLMLDQGVDVRLDIAGEDDMGGSGYRTTLEAALKRMHLQDHVRLLGALDEDDVRAAMAQAHIFVLASWLEPLGVVFMEAMAMGVPVIGTDAGGVPELVQDGRTGVLVPPRQPDTLARAIRDLAQDPERAARLGQAGRAHVEAGFQSRFGAEGLAEDIRATLDDAD